MEAALSDDISVTLPLESRLRYVMSTKYAAWNTSTGVHRSFSVPSYSIMHFLNHASSVRETRGLLRCTGIQPSHDHSIRPQTDCYLTLCASLNLRCTPLDKFHSPTNARTVNYIGV